VATIEDVARHAGVSASTVSYVLSGKRSISPETSRRVHAAIEALNYRPNASARALASRRSSALALMAPFRPDNNVPVLMQFVSAMATAAREREHDILLVTEQEGRDGLERIGHTSLVDAVIVMDVETDDARLPMLRTLGLPCVLIGQPDEPGDLSCVDLDFRQAGTLAVEHLVSLGHRSMAMLGSPSAVYDRRSTYAIRFAEGYEDAQTRHGIDNRWYAVEQSYEAAEALLVRHFADHPDTTALIVHNEAILGTVLAVLERLGKQVPSDVALVALCPHDLAINQRVRLTNIDLAAEHIGAAAVDMIFQQLDGIGPPQTRLIAPLLDVRASTVPEGEPGDGAQSIEETDRT
jgi:DNA-binding LacI/PurR family transcriptional regulator